MTSHNFAELFLDWNEIKRPDDIIKQEKKQFIFYLFF